ncbi:hypothetical protein SASPL_157490 [Salvia splendens]|uniref:Uncharacterized protein n=1 Tax=Salvia splendens TaxID=180675 RepID=A0A8X8VUU9_SALSN|nr:hypothetical protein SASPL_157490 [Salvia splendens]
MPFQPSTSPHLSLFLSQRWDMEILSPSSYFSNSSWLLDDSRWSAAENKLFENALALFDENTPDRWQKGSSLFLATPLPPFTLEWAMDMRFLLRGRRKAPPPGRPSEHERKEGDYELLMFLDGAEEVWKRRLEKISRNFVITRTPTQVASHAKNFIRQLSGGKDKRRASIHDITTMNLNDHQAPSPERKKQPSQEQPLILSPKSEKLSSYPWTQASNDAVIGFSSLCHGNMFASSPYSIGSFGHKMHGQHLQRGVVHDAFMGSQNALFQTQPELHYPNA